MTNPPVFFPTFDAAEREYRSAWKDTSHTRFELPPVNVNKILRDHYRMSPERTLTRTMIWDMEKKKAWDPRTYIPYVVSEGRSWGRRALPDGERFCRSSLQRGWVVPERGRVLEDVYVNEKQQAIFFLGCQRMTEDGGNELEASEFQPIFHVEHAVGGIEEEPLNLWSIVLLTTQNDARYHEPFNEMVRSGTLPGFIEIYIERDLGVKLARS